VFNKAAPLNLNVGKLVVMALLILQVSYCFSQSLKFEGVPEGMPLKRDKEYQMYWAGRLTAQIVSVQFRKNDLVVHEGPGFLKSGKYQISLPGNLLGNYTVLVLDPSTQAVLQSDEVKIKRRIPLVGQIGVAMGIAIMISFITA
jgi:hypothetical protein